jgi:hypothetical protein
MGDLRIERDKEWDGRGKMSIMQWCGECLSQVIKVSRVTEMERRVIKYKVSGYESRDSSS